MNSSCFLLVYSLPYIALISHVQFYTFLATYILVSFKYVTPLILCYTYFGVPKELRKLEEKLDTIKAVFLDAEEKQEESHAVKAWVRRLKDFVYDADDMLDDFATHQLQRGVARKVSDFFSSSF